MRFFLLGDIRVRRDGTPITLGRRQRAVLAVLLYRPNKVVPRTDIVRLVWGSQPDNVPTTVDDLVADYVSRLRTAFRQVASETEVRLVARAPGYMIDVDDQTIDWHQFLKLVDQARKARDAAEAEVAARLLWQGLELWHGPPLADVGPTLHPIRQEMEEKRLAAVEDLAAIELARRRAHRIVPLLKELAHRYPMRESTIALLISALHAAGRRDEAVSVYTRSRNQLADMLGLDPGDAVQAAYQALLRGRAPNSAATGADGPRQLPLDTPNFVGRTNELADLLALVTLLPADSQLGADAPTDAHPGGAGTTPAAGIICVVDGMAGVGKTTLAVHAAHRLARWFPDGQLFLDLHGYDAKGSRVDATEALGRLLTSLDVAGESVPQHLDDRAALYRDRLANRRVLILLDNAVSADQVRPLLPAAPGCLVLITSRRRLTALDDARPLPLESLPPTDAATLFTKVAGANRVSGQHADVERIIALCGGLPLALRIAAARLRDHPAWHASYLADQLSEASDPPWELDDGERSVAATLLLSYRELTSGQQQMFRLLGLVPSADVDAYAAAALVDAPADRAERLLEDLLDVHLLGQQAEGRYRLHDLVRLVAAKLAASEESEQDRRGALDRLLKHQLHTAAGTIDVLFPHERERRPPAAVSTTPTPDASTRAAARAWLDMERANLIAAATFAADHGWPDQVRDLSTILHRYLITGAHYADALALNQHALRAVRRAGDRRGEGIVLGQLGGTYRRLGRYEEALDHFGQALAAHQECGDRVEEAVTLTHLGVLLGLSGRYEAGIDQLHHAEALDREVGNHANLANTLASLGNLYMFSGDFGAALHHYQQALEISIEIGDRVGEGTALVNLGNIQLRIGEYDKAVEHYSSALEIFTDIGDRENEGIAQGNLGEAHERRGRYDLAVAYLRRALVSFRTIGLRHHESETLGLLAACYAGLQRYEEAVEQLRRALRIAQEIGDRTLEAKIANGLGATLRAAGQAEPALAAHRSALELAGRLGNRYEQARALEGIAELLEGAGDAAAAHQLWRDALGIYTDLGVAEAQRIRLRPPPAD